MATPRLVIGNRNYSTWSLRAWLFLRHHGIEFDETRLALDTEAFRQAIGNYSPSGRVPVLIHGSVRVWDSLAICEYVSDVFDGVHGWPEDPAARAEARSAVCEMHSGFAALRDELPMNCRARDRRVDPSPQASHDIGRIQTIWSEMRSRFGSGGPWLFGRFSIADSMFAPVAMRFLTYGVPLQDAAQIWMTEMLAHPAIREWIAAAEQEPEIIAADEKG